MHFFKCKVRPQIRISSLQQRGRVRAVIARLNLAHSKEADQLEICSDSQLVVKQIEDSYEARDEKNDPLPQKGVRAA